MSELLAALVVFAGFMALGFYVKTHAEPALLWAFAKVVRGHAIGLAWAFTNMGWAPVLVPLTIALLILAVASPRWRARALATVVSMLVCWGAADAFQHWFGRPRRDDWLIRHEHAFSYPSSHAAMAVGFYLFFGVLVLISELPRRVRVTGFAILAAVTLGIVWSRLALAAHYPTDVIGGMLLGAVVSLLAAAAVKVLAPPGARP